jgi:hypothetical protein
VILSANALAAIALIASLSGVPALADDSTCPDQNAAIRPDYSNLGRGALLVTNAAVSISANKKERIAHEVVRAPVRAQEPLLKKFYSDQ